MQRHQHQLASQLEYYRQLQIMHCQRLRDIELLQLQHQQGRPLQHQYHHTLHSVKRFHLAQRMLQAQTLHHARQIQRIQYLQKINSLQQQVQSPVSPTETTERPLDMNEQDLARLEIDTNTIHIPTRTTAPSRLDLQQILGHTQGQPAYATSVGAASPTQSPQGRSSHSELAKIVLPSSAHIRKQRQQRLKYQARLRQVAAATAATTTAAVRAQCEHDVVVNNKGLIKTDDVPNGDGAVSKATTTIVTRHERASVWTSSTTSIVPRPKADVQYKRQLRHSMALQQHMIQEHTHRYRIFQAFCLLQRAREAQALDEIQTQKRRQLQTLAWVEALRQSKELEIPQ
ncbi:hypothetical protein BGX28_007102 [Mortierella sp. GBA30]|nr:hypothetical protein BGX28_007102 [Mortierella sp. GBA30]